MKSSTFKLSLSNLAMIKTLCYCNVEHINKIKDLCNIPR